jgi:hypothetical protein
MARKMQVSTLLALLLVALLVTEVLAVPSIRFTLNGAGERYNAGAVFMLYGRTEDSGLALPDADVFVKAQVDGSPIFWSQVRSDNKGYFQTNFNLPNITTGTMTVSVSALGENQVRDYQLGTRASDLELDTIGFDQKPVNKLVPVSTKTIILAFNSNMNFFKNKNADPDLVFLGINEKNADCARIYEKATGKLVNTSVALVSNDTQGLQPVSFYDLEGQDWSVIRRDIIPLSLNESLKPNTTYRVVISGEIAANSSNILGQDQVIEFTTQASPSSSGGGSEKVAEQKVSSSGTTITENSVSIVIPPNAVADDIKVTVEKITDTTGLAMDNMSKLVSDVFEIVKDKVGDFSKPVTLTLTFDKSQVDPDKYDIQICYFDEKENKWIPLDNIKVDMANGTVSGDTTHFTKFAVIATEKTSPDPEKPEPTSVQLSDIKGHWAEQFIAELVNAGAVGGYPDGTFKPDQTISRAEFATILVKALQLPAKDGKVFDDTANHWGREYIATAAAHGIVSGYSDTAFGPDDSITREQMAVMIAKAANLQADSSQPMSFKDQEQISSWAAEAVSTSVSRGIIKGYPDNTFRPLGSATRAEAATVIVQTKKLAL